MNVKNNYIIHKNALKNLLHMILYMYKYYMQRLYANNFNYSKLQNYERKILR